MKKVLDASVFFSDVHLEGDLFTTPSVVAELKDLSSKVRFDLSREKGLVVCEPDPLALARVKEVTAAAGEGESLSATDMDILAAAVQLQAAVVTDDYALRNVARHLEVPVIPLRQRKTAGIRWKYRCTGCGRYGEGPGECPVCGAPVKRRIK